MLHTNIQKKIYILSYRHNDPPVFTIESWKIEIFLLPKSSLFKKSDNMHVEIHNKIL
jgi:hypothetical protein